METLDISKKQFDKLAPLGLESHIMNTESELFVIPSKNGWERDNKVLKKLYVTSGNYFSNKLFTVNSLIDNTETINISELVLPEKLAVVNNAVVGFIMPLIPNENLETILRSSEYTEAQKLAYLKETGEIIEKLKKVRTYNHEYPRDLSEFYLNDVHENNFILNKITGKINAVDLDSCRINGNFTFPSKYLSKVKNFEGIPKYEKIDNMLGAKVEPSENTELYCYTIMLLNYLYGDNISKLSREEFYNYLEYLHFIGMPFDMVDKFSNIYTNKENENLMDMTEYLEPFAMRGKKSVYELTRKRTIY